jgi:hypothetical protein
VLTGAWGAACWALVLSACKTGEEPLVASDSGGAVDGAADDAATFVDSDANPLAGQCSIDTPSMPCSTPGATCSIPVGAPCCGDECTCGVDHVWACTLSCDPCLGTTLLDAGDSGRKDAFADTGLDVTTTANASDAPADVLVECSADANCE